MRRVGDIYRAAGVSTIYLVHGTFDTLAGEHGNFTAALADEFQQALAGPAEEAAAGTADKGNTAENPQVSAPPILVRRFHWSGENHHAGRAEAAVQLVEELLDAQAERPGRLLVWGHSHAGNVFALVTNLIGGDRDCRRQFFEAALHLAAGRHAPVKGQTSLAQRVAARLNRPACQQLSASLDLVTFGTPIRYGWDTGGYARLLHINNHRPQPDLPPEEIPFPPTADAMLATAAGDYMQLFAVAGTNIVPSLFNWTLWRSDRRLQRLLQAGVRRRDLLRRWASGLRVPDEGNTLLVDYGPAVGAPHQHLFGHAVYTRRSHLLFHAETIARRFYAGDLSTDPPCRAAQE